MDKGFFIFMGFLIGLFFLIMFASYQTYTDFMEECRKDHKQYECTAMYRSGNRGRW